MTCKHRGPIAEYEIVGFQDDILLVTCPDCHSTIHYGGAVDATQVFMLLNEIALSLGLADVRLDACELAVECILGRSRHPLDVQFANDLLARIQRKREKLNRERIA